MDLWNWSPADIRDAVHAWAARTGNALVRVRPLSTGLAVTVQYRRAGEAHDRHIRLTPEQLRAERAHVRGDDR